MRLGRVALIVLPAILAAALLAAWLVPPQLDWAQYRAPIAQLAAGRMGLPVTIQGPIGLTLLPEPVLTAGRVSVGDPAQDGVLIRVQALRLRLAWWPLLRGRIDARELVLHGPDLHIPWPAQAGRLPLRPPAWLAAFAAKVEDGRLSVGQFAVTGIDGSLSSLNTDALRADVTAAIAGQRWRVRARLTAAGPYDPAALDVALDGLGGAAGTTASFSGRFTPQGPLAGTVKAAGPNLAVLLPVPALPFTAAGRLTVADGLAEADELRVQLNGAPASGAVALRMLPHPRLDIALSASRLALDPWTPLLLAMPLPHRLLPVGLDFSADAATLAGATLRHLRATFDLRSGLVAVRELAAGLPGNAQLELRGRMVRGPQGQPGFTGTGLLQAPVLRTTLDWLAPRAKPMLDTLPPDVVQQVAVTGDIELGPDHLLLQKLQGTLDGQTVNGSFGWKSGQPPAIAADLQFARLRLTPWLAAGIADAPLRQTVLHRLNTDLRLTAVHASLGGTSLDGLTLRASAGAAGVMLQRLQASALQARISASGSLGPDGRISGAVLHLATSDATPLVALLPTVWHGTPGLWHGPAQLALQAAGPRDAVAGAVSLRLGDLHLTAQPTVNLDAGTASGSLTLRDPDAKRLVSELGLPARLGLDGVPSWLGDGSLSLVGQARLGPHRLLALDHAELVAGTLRTRLNLSLDLGQAEPVLTGTVHAETLPLPEFGASILPVALLRGWQARLQLAVGQLASSDLPPLAHTTASLQLGQGQLHIRSLQGQLAGGAVTATASLDATQTPPALALQARLHDAQIHDPVLGLPFDLQSGQVSGSLALTAAGYGAAALRASLSGQLAVTAQDGRVSGFDLGRLRDLLQAGDDAPDPGGLRDALQTGSTPFQALTLQASIARGILTLDQAKLSGVAGTAQASGSIALADRTEDVALRLHPALPQAPELGVQLNGPVAQPQRTPQLVGLARWRARQVR